MIAFEKYNNYSTKLIITVPDVDESYYEILFKTLVNLAGRQTADFFSEEENYFIHLLIESMVPKCGQLKFTG